MIDLTISLPISSGLNILNKKGMGFLNPGNIPVFTAYGQKIVKDKSFLPKYSALTDSWNPYNPHLVET